MIAVVMSVTHLTFWPNRDPPVTADKLTTFTLYVHVQSCVKQLVMSICMSMFAITMLCPSVQLRLSNALSCSTQLMSMFAITILRPTEIVPSVPWCPGDRGADLGSTSAMVYYPEVWSSVYWVHDWSLLYLWPTWLLAKLGSSSGCWQVDNIYTDVESSDKQLV